MTIILQWLITGLCVGLVYAMFCAGYSLMFGVMRIVNLAHGALAILAAYIGLVVVQALGVSPFLAMAVVVPIMALGYVAGCALVLIKNDGVLPIKRTTFNIGDGEWKDTSVVADEVQIKFHVVAARNN